MAKERLDVLLVKRNLIDSREKAKRLIMAGLVFSDNDRLDKPGMKVDDSIPIHIKETMPYVGRGGYKLAKALDCFDTDIEGKIMVDIGASTGGFTDCALQHGVSLVYAIDVGYNQLAWKLRSDDRVIVHERTNFRYVTAELFSKGRPNYATIDVSFISLRLILPVLQEILEENSEVIALVKPQFEATKGQVGKKGVVRDPNIHREVLLNVIHFAKEAGYEILDGNFSPITGGEGNIEYLLHLAWKKHKQAVLKPEELVERMVKEAHDALS